MTNKYLFVILLLFSQTIYSQDFPGYQTGNYTGVNGVFFNPANIADSRYRFDVNLFSAGVNVGNNQASFKIGDITETFSGDSIINRFIGEGGTGTSARIGANFHGPSLMFNAGEKTAFALTSRARVMILASDIDGNLANQLINDADGGIDFPYSINSSKNMVANVNAWTEFGLSYARVLKDEGKHFFKAGISLKYLAGVANAYAGIDNLKGTLDEAVITGDPILANSTGRLQLGFGGLELEDFEVEDLTSFQSKGFGADLGFVYEFRPDYEQFKYGEADKWRRDQNKYKLKVSAALLDIGSIKYKRDLQRSGGYDIHITDPERLNLQEVSDTELDDLKGFLDDHPQFFTALGSNNENYKASLPTTLQLEVDYHFHRGFYINVAGQLSLVNTDKKIYNSRYYSALTITPRIEGRVIGLYIPVSYNELTEFTAGAALRMGPLFIGSGSVLTALLGESKQADAFVGLRFGGLQKNKEKKMKKKERKKA